MTGNPLRRMDDAVVPRLQRGTRSTLSAIGAPARAAHRFERRIFEGRLYRFAYDRRRVFRTITVVLALLGSAVHLQRYPELLEAREAERAAALQQTISDPNLGVAAPLPPGARVVGPTIGADPQQYAQEREDALAGLTGPQTAIVSFRAFIGVDEVLETLGEDALVLRAQYRLPDTRSTPLESEVVAGDLGASIGRILEAEIALLEEERDAQQELLDSGTIQSEEFERDARGRVEEIKTVLNVLKATGAIVFAVLVQADAAHLRDLARDERIRLVDVLPADADPTTSVVFGLVPDQLTRVEYGVPA